MWKIVGQDYPAEVRFKSERAALCEALYWAGDDPHEWNLSVEDLWRRLDWITTTTGEPIAVEPV